MLLREFFGLISESKCPYCGDPNAYVGAGSVECPNKRCSHFDPKTVKTPSSSNNVSSPSTAYPSGITGFVDSDPGIWAVIFIHPDGSEELMDVGTGSRPRAKPGEIVVDVSPTWNDSAGSGFILYTQDP